VVETWWENVRPIQTRRKGVALPKPKCYWGNPHGPAKSPLEVLLDRRKVSYSTVSFGQWLCKKCNFTGNVLSWFAKSLDGYIRATETKFLFQLLRNE
jgi:hypothetical protein